MRSTCSIPRHDHELEYRRAAHQGLYAGRNPRPAFLPLLHRGTAPTASRRVRCDRGEQGRYEEEGWRVRKDGTFFWASVVIDPIREDGELVGFAKITRDITERREAQLKLEQMQKQLAGIAEARCARPIDRRRRARLQQSADDHQRQSSYAEKGLGDDPKLQRALAAIETATKRGAALTSQLLTFARRQSLNPQVDRSSRADQCRARGARYRRRRRGQAGVRYRSRTSGRSWSTSPSSRPRWSISSSTPATPCPTAARSRSPRATMPAGDSDRRRRSTSPSPSSDTGTGIAPDVLTRSSTRSSPPSRSARAPASACRRSTASPIRPAERSR